MQVARLKLLAVIAPFFVGSTPASAQPTFTGIARNIDGDSLYVGEKEVRLFGIDAPEWGQVCNRGGQPWNCGSDAADHLAQLVNGKPVSCAAVDTDEHGRTVARCSVSGSDVNRTMVSDGYAVAYRHYSTDYVSAEAGAKAQRLGLWSGTFEMPTQYRHEEKGQRQGHRSARRNAPTASATAPSGSCNIKGNRGSNGWLYHVPGMPFYDRTKAEEMFCSEAAAQAAGYRRAKVR